MSRKLLVLLPIFALFMSARITNAQTIYQLTVTPNVALTNAAVFLVGGPAESVGNFAAGVPTTVFFPAPVGATSPETYIIFMAQHGVSGSDPAGIACGYVPATATSIVNGGSFATDFGGLTDPESTSAGGGGPTTEAELGAFLAGIAAGEPETNAQGAEFSYFFFLAEDNNLPPGPGIEIPIAANSSSVVPSELVDYSLPSLNGTISVVSVPVPEPASFALISLTAGGLLARRRGTDARGFRP